MSKLVNHQEIIDSKKTNKEKQKFQTNKNRHLLINMFCFRPQTSSTPGPQTPTIRPFWGTIKSSRNFGARSSGLGEILRQIIEFPNLDFQGWKSLISWESQRDVYHPPCHVYTAPPQKKNGRP